MKEDRRKFSFSNQYTYKTQSHLQELNMCHMNSKFIYHWSIGFEKNVNKNPK